MGKFRVIDENGEISDELGENSRFSNNLSDNTSSDRYEGFIKDGDTQMSVNSFGDLENKSPKDDDYEYMYEDDFRELEYGGSNINPKVDKKVAEKNKRWESYANEYDRQREIENKRKIEEQINRKNHKLIEKSVVGAEDLRKRDSRSSKKLGEPVNLETNNILREDGRYEESKTVVEKKDLVLRRTKPKKSVGTSFNVSDVEDRKQELKKEDKRDSDKLVIKKPVRKDLQLSKSKFSEKKQDTWSWSMESLGIQSETQSSGTNSTKKKGKKEKKEKSKPPVLQLLLCGVFVIFIIGFIVSQKMSGDVGFLEGRDMYPTLDTNSITKFKPIEDYNNLKYMDIVLYEANGELIPSRIIGFPGDTIEIRSDGVYLNDEKIDPNLIGGEFDFSRTIRKASDDYKFNDGAEMVLHYKLEEGSDSVFLLGDNHQGARDSITYGPIYVGLLKKYIVE